MSEDPFAILERIVQQQPRRETKKKSKEAPQPIRRTSKNCASCGGTDHQHGRACQCKLCLPTHIPLTAEERLGKELSILR